MHHTSDTHRAAARTLVRLAAVAGFVFAAVLWSGSAWAYPVQTGTLSTSGALVPGGTVILSGDGYASGTSVAIDVYSVGARLKTVRADGAGDFSASVTLPSNLSAGEHTLQATGAAANGGVLILSKVFTVAGGDDGDDDVLPVTGQRMTDLAATGLAALLLGTAVLWHTRRPRSPMNRRLASRDRGPGAIPGLGHDG